ncbi:hypothetical protein DH2020_045925 [Rehmannia glutinosa]|uniref:Uncharacterized protein n=1 Tax=Rehmannia glutinosa TaxID=99300 RepID=A0ABR0UCI4_REHGL
MDDFDSVFNGDANDAPKSTVESLVLPFEGMEIENQLRLFHLFKAYTKAMDDQEGELSMVIANRIIQKVNPIGGTRERVFYYMFQHLNDQSDYLLQESIKNFYPAFKAFYQIFPYGKFAHFVANSTILEALPLCVETIHLIDFDIGEGVQWASFLEAIKYQNKEIRITSLKFNEEDEIRPLRWRFEGTKRRLCDLARSYGLKLKVEEVGLQDLECFVNNIKKEEYGRKSLYVFNCNVGLPHMGRVRSKKDVLDFLRVAKNFLQNVTCWDTCKGIITYGNGDALQNTTNSMLSYSSFLDGNFSHYRALLESMESIFPNHLGEARIALECLFVAPYVSSVEWDRRWEERRECGELDEFGVGLERWELSEASLVEAKEVVKEGVSLYGNETDLRIIPPLAEEEERVELPAKGCDLSKGKWVFDNVTRPLYKEEECEFLTAQVTCIRNGKQDTLYQNWRWQPDDCSLPNKIVVGEAEGEEAYVCGGFSKPESMGVFDLLAPVRYSSLFKRQLGKRGAPLSVFHIQDYNATVEFYWAPFLVESNSDDSRKHSISQRIIMPESISKHGNNWKNADFLVFNTYIWWMNSHSIKVLRGSFDQGSAEYDEVERSTAYERVLTTWAKWLRDNVNHNRTSSFFISMSPVHQQSSNWNNPDGITCALETAPILNTSMALEMGTDRRLLEVARKVIKATEIPVTLIDITTLSEYRKDGHTSIYTIRQGKLLTPEQKADPATFADCLHWCLPGVPDTWNELLYANIISKS